MPTPSPFSDLLEALPQRERRVEAAGTSTAVFEYGAEDAPPVVFVHGFRGDHHGLEPIAAHLPGLRVIAPDLPGFGASDALPLASIDAYADHLIALVAELAPGAPVLGHSFGSIVVAHAAARGLDTSRIVLVNPIATPALEGGSRLGSLAALGYYRAAAALPERAGLALLGAPPIVRGMSAFMAKTRDRALRAWIHEQHDRYFSTYASRQAVLEAFDASIRHTVGEVAASIRQPVQLIAADRDDITPLAHQHRLRATFPDARLSVLTGVGHLVHYERPREAAAIVRRFLAEEAGGSVGGAAA
ncbi:alpha/beta fold hydrolase [Agrococcus terreus]|uniref:Alpha/beta hydrolase n=1 Tax=Agrococcus terreus TaxID=574649 RepID=A0ABQ2KHZ2_9MICO|nr:alpha/beta fold hydrolase [Agrococcus terreus]GGN84055.1 alpha/beta hydrolase [Agrococcus terreus]